ncbi:MAG: hypothetical protein BGO05_18605 [Rhizobiales bacterium 63-7]|nr:hypothetical protein [Hyphomicrobiales bacterium]OJU65899.1 MAG: hypothetical protein BGO05_18605 [Rhizobiales bacterium 63-7]
MNMYVKAKEYASADEMMAEYKARQDRTRHQQNHESAIRSLRKQNSDLRAALNKANAERMSLAKGLIEARGEVCEKVTELQRLQTRLASLQARIPDDIPEALPVKDIIVATLLAYPGISLTEIFGQGRRKPVADARKACMRAVYTQRPDLSSTQIAAVFKRDHTTLLHAVGATARSKAAE